MNDETDFIASYERIESISDERESLNRGSRRRRRPRCNSSRLFRRKLDKSPRFAALFRDSQKTSKAPFFSHSQFLSANLLPSPNFEVSDEFRWRHNSTGLADSLVRYDSNYFLHVAQRGYTEERTICFFPFYPMLIRLLSRLLLLPTAAAVAEADAMVAVAYAVNAACFVSAADSLYLLTKSVLGYDFNDTCDIYVILFWRHYEV